VTPVLATLRDAGFDAKAVKRTGDAAEAIAAYAGENADLIVMGSHGWGKFKSAVLGSTAAKVGAATELPILIIRSDKDELLV
jgi:nucleotide-binding universal stress UspA family protein